MPALPEMRRTIPADATIASHPMRDGWPVRDFDWPVAGAARGSILFQGGRGDIIEKYLESFAHWHSRGWHVTAFDWRGQGGSGRLLPDASVGHSPGFGVWIDDLAEFWSRWRQQSSGPYVVIGHSMGGHLLLRGLAEKRIDPDAAILIAPMLGFETGPLPVSWVAALVGVLARGRLKERRAWPSNERPAAKGASRQQFLTHDDDRYADELWWKAQQPELALGPPSIGWLADAYASVVGLRAPGVLEAIATPIALIGTEGDKLVAPAAIRAAAARLPVVSFHMFGTEVAHEILRERDTPRDEALRLIDAALDEAKS